MRIMTAMRVIEIIVASLRPNEDDNFPHVFSIKHVVVKCSKRCKVHFSLLMNVFPSLDAEEPYSFKLGIVWDAGRVYVFEDDVIEKRHFSEYPVGGGYMLREAFMRALGSGVRRYLWRLDGSKMVRSIVA